MKFTRDIRILAGLLLFAVLAGCGASKGAPAPTTAPEPSITTETPAADELTVVLLSTGKSDCSIFYIDGLVILCDTADADDYPQIAAELKARGVSRIDYILLSHYDKDHIGSAAQLIRNFTVGVVVRPDHVEESGEYYALMKALSASGTEDLILKNGNYCIRTANGIVTVDPPDEDYGDDNNNSVLVSVSYRGRNLLFMGDARKKRIEEFLRTAPDSFDFIKLPHHGDGNKALYSLLRQSSTRWAAETVSEAESVEPELITLLDKLGITLFLTSDGPVRITWSGETLTAEQTAR